VGWVDLLDEFTEAAKPVPDGSGSNIGGVPGAAPGLGVGEDDVDDDFAQELQRGMADLLGELEGSVGDTHFEERIERGLTNYIAGITTAV